MSDAEKVRVELAFDGGQIIAALVSSDAADALDRALTSSAQGALQLETDDGVLSVLPARVVYAKRFSREAQVGFGN